MGNVKSIIYNNKLYTIGDKVKLIDNLNNRKNFSYALGIGKENIFKDIFTIISIQLTNSNIFLKVQGNISDYLIDGVYFINRFELIENNLIYKGEEYV